MKKVILIIILVIFIIILICSKNSFGKYFSKTNIEVGTEIAKPIFKIEGDTTLNINTVKEKEIYQFKVKNYDEDNKITEVDLEYYIEIIPKENENIKCKIYKKEKELNMYENKTEKFLLTKEKMQEDNYKMEILLKNISVQEFVQNIEVKVHAEQKNK